MTIARAGPPALALLAARAVLVSPLAAQAQPRKDNAVLAMTLEPPGLDPTADAASAIAEITLHNIFETLTKVGSDARIENIEWAQWLSGV